MNKGSYKIYLKAFISGFDYAVKNYSKIEDHRFSSLPGAKWFDPKTQNTYRRGIRFGRKYMQYRLELLTLTILLVTTYLFVFAW